MYGTDSKTDELKDAIYNMTGLKSVSAEEDKVKSVYRDENGFCNEVLKYSDGGVYEKLNGKVYTLFDVVEITSKDALSEEAALNIVAEKADKLIAALAKTSHEVKTGEKYYSYSYDGNVSMVSAKAIDGTTNYYVAYVVNQTVTEKTL